MRTFLFAGLLALSFPAFASQADLDAQLVTGAFNGNLPQVQSAVKAGANLDTQNGQPLKSAVNAGSVEVVKFLLNQKDFTNVQKRATESLTNIWAVKNQEQIIKLLLSVHPDVNQPDQGGTTPLVNYGWDGSKEVLKLLVDAGADVNYKIPEGSNTYLSVTSLCAAVSAGMPSIESVKYLLSVGANPNVVCFFNEYKIPSSALDQAAMIGNKEMVKALIQAGADVNFKVGAQRQENALANTSHVEVIKLPARA